MKRVDPPTRTAALPPDAVTIIDSGTYQFLANFTRTSRTLDFPVPPDPDKRRRS
jgi:hypothetical protein